MRIVWPGRAVPFDASSDASLPLLPSLLLDSNARAVLVEALLTLPPPSEVTGLLWYSVHQG